MCSTSSVQRICVDDNHSTTPDAPKVPVPAEHLVAILFTNPTPRIVKTKEEEAREARIGYIE